MNNEKYVIAVCSSGPNFKLIACLDSLIESRRAFQDNVEILLILNQTNESRFTKENIEVEYEPNPGYSNVRNKALTSVPRGTNLIFVDDDEIASQEWLVSLIQMHMKYPDDLVVGPVFPFERNQTSSLRGMRAQHVMQFEDGSTLLHAGAGNMLIPSSILDSNQVRFDNHFNQSGSEDTDLCFRLRNKGYQIRFAAKAIIYEMEDLQRFESTYIQQRMRKDIVNYSVVVRRNDSFLNIALRFLKLLIRLIKYSSLGIFRKKSRIKAGDFGLSLLALINGRVRI